jgi:hypothetical protein
VIPQPAAPKAEEIPTSLLLAQFYQSKASQPMKTNTSSASPNSTPNWLELAKQIQNKAKK